MKTRISLIALAVAVVSVPAGSQPMPRRGYSAQESRTLPTRENRYISPQLGTPPIAGQQQDSSTTRPTAEEDRYPPTRPAENEAVVREIKNRYSFAFARASAFCPGIKGKLDSVATAAGVSLAGGIGTTLAGGTAFGLSLAHGGMTAGGSDTQAHSWNPYDEKAYNYTASRGTYEGCPEAFTNATPGSVNASNYAQKNTRLKTLVDKWAPGRGATGVSGVSAFNAAYAAAGNANSPDAKEMQDLAWDIQKFKCGSAAPAQPTAPAQRPPAQQPPAQPQPPVRQPPAVQPPAQQPPAQQPPPPLVQETKFCCTENGWVLSTQPICAGKTAYTGHEAQGKTCEPTKPAPAPAPAQPGQPTQPVRPIQPAPEPAQPAYPAQPGTQPHKADPLNTGRMIGSFIAGGTSAVSAVSSFVGVSTFNSLIQDMNACDSYVREISSIRTELAAEDPSDSLLAQMDDIVTSCSGLNSRNISDVRGMMIANGVISTTGAVAGTAGGAVALATGAQGGKGTAGQNIAVTALTGTTAATGIASTILSGMTLSGLKKNGEIAARCATVF